MLVSVCPGCDACVGAPHHWLSFIDERTGDPGFVCKHCPATKEITLASVAEVSGVDIGAPGGDFSVVSLVSIDGEGNRVVGDTWRLCIWCREPIVDRYDCATCGRNRCQQRETAWLAAHPNWDKDSRTPTTIRNERYF